MSNQIITMPHRHTVRYKEGTLVIDFEVELLQDGIILYRRGVKVVSGVAQDIKPIADVVERWLSLKFSQVEVDDS